MDKKMLSLVGADVRPDERIHYKGVPMAFASPA